MIAVFRVFQPQTPWILHCCLATAGGLKRPGTNLRFCVG